MNIILRFIIVFDMNSDPEELKWLIFNSTEPLIFKNVLTSQILRWTLPDWSSILKDKVLEFRSGVNDYTEKPQWERNTTCFKESFNYLINHSKSEPKSWIYFDYKYLKEWLTDAEELRNNITWAPLGFSSITPDDCTIWIGSKGAHTPCHIDTYGFNLIFQVYGKKQWIIAPPEEDLKPTRIPYEESSIYSKLNFFSPSLNDFKGVNNCRRIILNPGEVLFLPHKWWHYVENLETAISINVWIPLPQDNEERLKEAIVQLFVKQITEVSNKEVHNLVLNPNMEESILKSDFGSFLETLVTCKNICKEKSKSNKKIKSEHTESSSNEEIEINKDKMMDKYKFIEQVPKMTREEFNSFLMKQSNRFKSADRNDEVGTSEDNILELLNIYTDSDVITLISEKLLGTNT